MYFVQMLAKIMKYCFVYAKLLNSLVSLAPIFLLHTVIVYYKDPNLQGSVFYSLRTVVVYYKDPNLQGLDDLCIT